MKGSVVDFFILLCEESCAEGEQMRPQKLKRRRNSVVAGDLSRMTQQHVANNSHNFLKWSEKCYIRNQ